MIRRVLSGKYLTGNNHYAKESIYRAYRWSVPAGHCIDVANEEAGCKTRGSVAGLYHSRQAGLSRAVSGLSPGRWSGGAGDEPAAGEDKICAGRQESAGEDRADGHAGR